MIMVAVMAVGTEHALYIVGADRTFSCGRISELCTIVYLGEGKSNLVWQEAGRIRTSVP
jgi:hypothetical protein